MLRAGARREDRVAARRACFASARRLASGFDSTEARSMKALSAHTLELDPYRAGIVLADALAPVEPEVVLLFSTIAYGDSPELTEAIYDVLGDRLVLIGCTGDGFFETRRSADIGAAALGINSGGTVKFHVSHASGASRDTRGATERCVRSLKDRFAPGGPDLVMLFADFRADGSAIERALSQSLGVPVVGGLAGDNNLMMQRSYTYANRGVLDDAIVVLGIQGALKFDIHVAHELKPVGRPGFVTSAGHTELRSIDGLSAMEFVEREIGRPVSRVDQGIVTLGMLDREVPELRALRSIRMSSTPGGELSLFGAIEEGTPVQVCIAHPDDVVREVERLAERVRDDSFCPAAAIIVSCAGRKHLLGNRIAHEASEIVKARGGNIALAGFPSFGEIGPVKVAGGLSPALFHNMTYVLLLIGG
jgi:hypothetical protein